MTGKVRPKKVKRKAISMKFTITYRKARIMVRGEKPNKCEICGKAGKIDGHHMKYAYKTSKVRKNPQLALENIIWLCFHCHMVGDAVRICVDNPATAKAIRGQHDITKRTTTM